MTPLPKIDGLIDYPFTEHKSEFFDIFLASTCRFCIGTSSGYWSVPIFFGKPVLLTNYLPFFDYYSLDEKSLFLPKSFIDKDTKKMITTEKMFKSLLGHLNTNIQLDQNNINIIDNNEDEIFQATVEMLDSLDSKKNNEKFTTINEKFKKHLDALNTTKYEFPLKAMANFSTSFIKKSNQQSYI
jgi:putative glycosyltransferase (TIGR04372 family)